MNITAKLIQILPMQTGTGKNGSWRKQEYIFETETQYPKKICISLWGDKIDENKVAIGQKYDVAFDLESKEFNGKWYTEVRAWKITSLVPETINNSIEKVNQIQQENEEDHTDVPF